VKVRHLEKSVSLNVKDGKGGGLPLFQSLSVCVMLDTWGWKGGGFSRLSLLGVQPSIFHEVSDIASEVV